MPLYIIIDHTPLSQGSMNPVDPRTSFLYCHRSRCPKDKNGCPVYPCIVNSHGGVEQTNGVMDNSYHGLGGYQVIAMSDIYRNLLVEAKDYLWLFIATVINDGVVKFPEGCPRVYGGILNIQGLHQVDKYIGTILCLGNSLPGCVNFHISPLLSLRFSNPIYVIYGPISCVVSGALG